MIISPTIEGKRVKVTHISGEIFTGIVGDYTYPEDNEPEGIATIILDDCPQRDYLLGIDVDKITAIEVT